jgi:catechol 2,3-dioxygenase-like lactoylglutathione lyase family enzyme
MHRHIALFTLVVAEYDEAIDFYVNKLNFHVVEDTHMSEDKRWVVISPSPESECKILLAKAANEAQNIAVGNQTGARVGFFLYTDNIQREYVMMKDNKVNIIRELSEEPFGKVIVFSDIYGNLWDMIERG